MSRVAVLDLGTNTFHLLIVEVEEKTFSIVYQERIYTKLGQEGIKKIGGESYQRGIEAIGHFAQIIKNKKVKKIKALGTAALRHAENGQNFIDEISEKFHIKIEIIDGLAEAEYIYKGVVLAIPQQFSPYLIMDIGGGSVEFIISDSKNMVYKESINIGLAPLHAVADISDIAAVDDVIQLHKWLAGHLSNLYAAIRQFQPRSLVGSAGAFEVLISLLGEDFKDSNYFELGPSEVSDLYVQILGSSKAEKLAMAGLPKERVDYISAAFVLIWHIFDTVRPKTVVISKYALKEGVVSTFLD